MIFDKFFEANNWKYDGSILHIFDVKLKVPIEGIPQNKIFDVVTIDFEDETIAFIEYDIAESKVLSFEINILPKKAQNET